MPASAETKIVITGEDNSKKAFNQAENSLESLERQTRELQGATRQTAVALGLFDDEIKKASVGVDTLGRNIFKTSAEARKFNGIFRDARGVLREANGEYAKTRIATQGLGKGFAGASGGAKILTGSLGGLAGAFAGLGVTVAGAALLEFGKNTISAAGRLELLTTGLTNVEGSSIAAAQRLEELDAIARLPGANLESLVRYSARLQAAGVDAAEVDSILRNTGQAIVVMGGSAELASQSLEQISQAIEKNVIVMQDLRPIIQRVPGFLQAIGEAHGVEPTLDGLREASERLGGSVKDALLPVLERLGQRFAAPPPESYVRSIDELQNSYFLFQATLGEKVLPAVSAGARGLANMLDSARSLLQGTEDLTASMHDFNQSVENREGLIQYVQTLRELRNTQQEIIENRQWWQNVNQATENVEELNKYIRLYEDALAGVPGAEQALQNELSKTSEAIKEAQSDYVQALSNVKLLAESNLQNADLLAATAENNAKAASVEIEALKSKQRVLQGATNALKTYNEQQKVANEETERASPVLRNYTRDIDLAKDNIDKWRTALREATTEAQATEAYDNLTTAIESLRTVQQASAEQAADGVAFYNAERDSIQALMTAEEQRSKTLNRILVEETDARQRQTDARIQSAERSRAAEVAGFEAAAKSGESYAAQLAQLATVSQRRAFVEIVNRFQEQGLSLDEARTKAEPYISVIGAIPPVLNAADAAYGNFTSTLVRESNRSADAVFNLVSGVETLADVIGTRFADLDVAGSLERSLLNEQRYFEQNPIGLTIENDQQRAYQQGLAYVNRLFQSQARESQRRLQAGLREVQNYAVTASDILASIDNDYAQLTSRMAENTFDFVRLASGDFTALGDIAFSVIDFIEDREAHLHEVRKRQAEERIAFETEAAERITSFSDIERAFGAGASEFITPSDRRFSPGQRADELSELGLTAPITTLPEIDLQALVDSAPDISQVLSGQIEQELTAALATSIFNGEDIAQAYQPFLDSLENAMARAGESLEKAILVGLPTAEITGRFNDYISAINDFYQLRIEEEEDAGRLTFRVRQELDRARADAHNQARLLFAGAVPSINPFAIASRTRAAQSRAEAGGFDRDYTEGIAAAQYGQEVYDAEVSAGQASEALQTQIANRVANEALGAIREAAGDANATTEQILNLWETALPQIEDWYQELLDDANAIENEGERTEAIAALGTQQDFVARLKSQYVTPVLMGISQATETLQTRTANRLAQDALSAISEAASDVNATEADILEKWTAAIPSLENWWQELYEDIINNPNLSDAQQAEDLAALGSQQDFVSSLKSQYVTPVITGIQRSAEALETRTANRLAQEALGAISVAASDANVTETEIAQLWTDALPLLENWYQELLDDANAIENDAERTEALAALGSPEQFIANLKSQYVTPVITGIQRSQEAFETRTANRLAQAALGGIREAANDANITEQGVLDLWTAALPLLETWYQELLDDANAIENEGDRNEAIAALGSPEQFIANLKAQYVTPIITGIRSAAENLQTRTASRLANEALDGIREAAQDANVTEQEIADLWTAAIPLLETWYQELLDDANAIENEGERAEAIAALGSVDQFVANLKSQYVTPVIQGIRSAQESLETRTANRLANEALGAIRTASEDANVTEAEIVNLWTTALPLIENWYQELLQDAQAIENEGERTEAIAALGSPEQFVANLKSQYVTPVIMGIRRSAEALETRTANRLANTALQGIREAASDVNVTEAEITRLWTEALPLIETWYQKLLDDAEAIENEGERAEAIAALGSPEQFVANLKSQYVTPVLNGIAQSTEALQTRTANREAQTAIQALRDVAGDVNVTEQAIRDKWQEAIPFIRTWWQELHDDIENNENLSESQIAESLAELGSVEAFVGNIRSQYVTPVLNNILQTRFQNRSNLAQNRLNRAQFNLGFASSESDFEHRRSLVVDAINAYYDAEEERINNLEASEEELKNLRQDNDDARKQALVAIISEENQYLEIKREQAEALIDLEEETQEKITDIRRKATQDREDIQREFSRDIEDILRESGAEDALFRSGDFRDIVKLAQLPDQSFLTERLSALGIELSDDALSDIRKLARERTRDQEDVNTRTQRAIAAAQADSNRQLIDINNKAAEATSANTLAIEALTTELQAVSFEGEQTEPTGDTPATETIGEIATDSAEAAESSAEAATAIEGTSENLLTLTEMQNRDMLDRFDKLLEIEQSALQTADLTLAGVVRSNVNLEALVNATFGGSAARDRLIEEIEGLGATLPDAIAVAVASSATTEPTVRTEISELLEKNQPLLTDPHRQDIIDDIIRGTATAIAPILQSEAMTQPLTDPVLGTPQTTPIVSTPQESPLAAGGGSIPVVVTNISELSSAVSGLSDRPLEITIKPSIIELDGDKVAESVENNVVERRSEGRSLL